MATRADRPKGKKISDLGMVWRFAKAYPGHIAAALLALLVAAAATSGVPYAFKLIIDRGFSGDGDISRWFEYLLMLVIVMAIATAVRFYFVSWIGERVVADIRLAVYRNLLRLAPSFFETNRPAEITSRMTVDTTIIEQVVGTTVSIALRNLIMGLACGAILVWLAPKLAGMIMLGLVVIVVPIIILARKVRAVSTRSQERIADVGTVSSEVLGAMKIVQAFGQQGREADRFTVATERVFSTARTRIGLRAAMTFIVISLMFTAITLVIWQGAVDVAAGRITGGTIAAFVLYGGLLAGAFGALSEVYGDLLRAAGASERLNELLNAEADIAPPENPAVLPPARGHLQFESVTFRYPTRPDTAALEDFSLEIRPDETVAVVGPSGAGKTTLFQLAQRFYDPQGGRVLIDGVDLRDADPADVRARIAMVPQDVVIFAASARDNLRYGNWDASEDEIWQAAADANAETFLRALPEGLDTFMGEGGARLSGGQRQRLAIARALLRRDAPLLLLDEATSALDAESERLVQQALERLVEGRTTIVIAHRLATVRKADRIIVMDHGRIVEEGTHSALAAQDGLYARLARLQFD